MFLSSFESSVDAKKRVSIPAPFRKSLGGEDSVYLWPSLDKACIEGAGMRLMEGFEDSMADLDLMDPRRYALATYIMGEARPSKFDEGGRIVLDAEAMREQMRALARESLGLLKAKPRRAGQAAAE